MIKRTISSTIQEHLNYFPVIAIMGPRQSGKSTIVQNILRDFDYINLEDANARKTAIEDPIGFINSCKSKTIIDEAQLAPEIFSAIQLRIDKNQLNGEFVLTGSHNFLLQKQIKQSLAGRISMLTLLPLSFEEIFEGNSDNQLKNNPLIQSNNTQRKSDKPIVSIYDSINNTILQGMYPRIYNQKIPFHIFYRNYIDTYIARDVQGYLNIRNITTFNNFLTLLAHDIGSTINYQRYANDLQTDARTIKEWINILVASYIIFLLPSYSTNTRKQVVKSPKLYFCDTGLACYVNKITDVSSLTSHANFGKIYENFIIVDLLKAYLNKADDQSLHFYRDKSKLEINLVDNSKNQIIATEIKATMTYQNKHIKNLKIADDLLSCDNVGKQLLYRGDRSYTVDNVKIVAEKDWFA